MNDLRQRGAHVLTLDGGNLFFYKRLLKGIETDQLVFKARAIVEAYNEIGVDAVALGPYDFAAGYERLLELQRLARFPFLCANLLQRETGEPVFQPHVIVRRAGLSVGIIGVIDSFSPIEGLGPLADRLRVEPVYSSVKRQAKQLGQEGCDLIIVLSSVDPKKYRLLAKNVDEVQLYVAGDPADKLRIPWKIGPAMVANTTQLGKYLGHVQVSFEGAPGSEPLMRHNFVAMKPEYFDDPVVKRIVDGYYKHVAMMKVRDPGHYFKEREEAVNLQYGRSVYVSAAECQKCHPEIYEKWQATHHAKALSDLPTDHKNRVECLECHVTGFGRWGGFSGPAEAGPDLAGVQCEVCHGPGSLHPASGIARNGERLAKVCRGCHTRSRSPDFKLKEYMARIACNR